MTGNSLGKYQLIVELARGGMGVVYLARIPGPAGFRKLIIVKELKPEYVEDEAFLEMFLEEARLAARLEHANIVQTMEVGDDAGRHFIAMEYLQGQPLERVRRRLKDPDPLLKITAEALRGLHHAHTLTDFDGSNLGLVHRDVSATNIFVTYAGHAKLVDFGVSKAADSTLKTQAGTFKGKTGYMAPEQFLGKPIDARVDVYACGVMLCELVTGKRFWDGVTEPEAMKRLLSSEIPSLRELKPDVDDELAHICDTAKHPDRDQRYKSAEELRLAIETYLAKRPPFAQGETFGALVANAFEKEREALRAIVEKALAQAKTADAEGTTAPLVIANSASELTSSAERRPSGLTPGPTASVTQVGGSSRRSLGVGIGIGAVAILALGGAFLLGGSKSGTTPGVTAANDPVRTSTPPEPMPGAAAAKRPFRVDLSLTPPTAAVTANGTAIEGTTVDCPTGTTLHLNVAAPGYAARDRDVVCDGDRNVEVSLEKRADGAGAAVPAPRGPIFTGRYTPPPPRNGSAPSAVVTAPVVTAPPTPATAATATTPEKPVIKKPQRHIDPTNPYND